MRINLIPYSIAIGLKNIYFLTLYFKFIKKILMKMISIDYLNIMFQIVKSYGYKKFIQNIDVLSFLN